MFITGLFSLETLLGQDLTEGDMGNFGTDAFEEDTTVLGLSHDLDAAAKLAEVRMDLVPWPDVCSLTLTRHGIAMLFAPMFTGLVAEWI